LRRVSEGQRRQKSDELKQELKAEKIIEMTAHALKMDAKALYDKIANAFLKNYFYIYQAFEDFLNGNISLKEYFDADIAESLEKIIREKVKPKEIIVAGDLTISTWAENGVEDIRKALASAYIDPKLSISYLGGGRYRIIIKGTDYKVVEKLLTDASDSVMHYMKKCKGQASYERVKNIALETAAS
jgi:translation initiation factor 2 subunit 1